jgi:propionate CoA-transferase
MRSKIVTADEAIALIRDGDTLASTGFVQTGFAEALLSALERRFLDTGSPKNLTLFAAAGQGDGKALGLNHLGHAGLLRRVVAGHWGRMPKVGQLALGNRIQAYNLPQGIICQLPLGRRPDRCLGPLQREKRESRGVSKREQAESRRVLLS